MTHTCECGNSIVSHGWNNNIGNILRCQECNEKRTTLIAEISAAIAGKSVEMVYVSWSVYGLLSMNDFTVEISLRRIEKMNGQAFQVVEA